MYETEKNAPPLELWAGLECTINRVRDSYGNQFACNTHADSLDILDKIAELGVRALRYPVLWEAYALEPSSGIDFTKSRQRLERLREHSVRPIVGLVHHGSGPRHTSLVEESFVEGLADYARHVAEAFPWVEDWTPVNEPMTTARFSGLYGHWYPHGRNEATFARALVTQCRAVSKAMTAIRAVNPSARLIQTDDLGKTYSSPHLQYQADFENERRWLSWDLLCGLVDRCHRMWGHLLWCGISEAELHWFLENPCPPDIIGVNHYLTSERYIDERLELFPGATQGGNGCHKYADIEAVRVLAAGTEGVHGILREAWQRYGRPIAITEAHLGCTREEQMRWLLEVWQSADDLKRAGADVRAVTAWSLLGAYDWNSLLTRFEGCYETGVYDLRAGEPRPTALASLLRDFAKDTTPSHPVLATPGWWRRPKRLLYAEPDAHPKNAYLAGSNLDFQASPSLPLLITGANGRLGYAFARLCHHRGLACLAVSHEELDVTDASQVVKVLDALRPWAVINAAGLSNIHAAEADPQACLSVHAEGASNLARACAERGLPLVIVSSSAVFSGEETLPRVESSPICPVHPLGRSHAEAERLALSCCPSALVVRTGPLFSPWDNSNFLMSALEELAAGKAVQGTQDIMASPTYVPDFVHACLDLLIDGERGIWHLTNAGGASPAELVRQAAQRADLFVECLQPISVQALACTGLRPLCIALDSERGHLLPSLDTALACFLRDSGIDWQTRQAGQHVRREISMPKRGGWRGRGGRASKERPYAGLPINLFQQADAESGVES